MFKYGNTLLPEFLLSKLPFNKEALSDDSGHARN